MLIDLFSICEHRNIWSFRPQPGATPVAVRVPEGSKLREVRGLGTDLYIPSLWDQLQLIRWNANQVMREAKPGGRFTLVKTKGRERVTG